MQAPNVRNYELLKDIETTEKEAGAYLNIASGFNVLAQLPENDVQHDREYRFKYYTYQDLYEQCSAFLQKLYEIRKERGLE